MVTDYKNLVIKLNEKFEPESIFLLEVPPIFDINAPADINDKIKSFNEKLNEMALFDQKLTVIPIFELLMKPDSRRYFNKMGLHMNTYDGLAFLKMTSLNITLETPR